MQRNVEKFVITRPLHPKIVSYPVRRSGAMYGMGFYATQQQPVDMVIKTGIGAALGYVASMLGVPHGTLIGAGLGLASTMYSNYKLRSGNSGVSGCCS